MYERSTKKGPDGFALSMAESYLVHEYAGLTAWVDLNLGAKLSYAGVSSESVIHELYFRIQRHQQTWESETHFLNWTRRAANHIVLDAVRRKLAETSRRLDPAWRVSAPWLQFETNERVYLVRDALGKLARAHPRQTAVVTMRYLEGYSANECAGRLGISERTVKRDCLNAFAWLRRELN